MPSLDWLTNDYINNECRNVCESEKTFAPRRDYASTCKARDCFCQYCHGKAAKVCVRVCVCTTQRQRASRRPAHVKSILWIRPSIYLWVRASREFASVRGVERLGRNIRAKNKTHTRPAEHTHTQTHASIRFQFQCQRAASSTQQTRDWHERVCVLCSDLRAYVICACFVCCWYTPDFD